MANSPIKTRLKLHRDWQNDLPLKFLWTVDFATRDGRDTATLGARINNVISQYERRNGQDWVIVENLLKDQSDSSSEYGYLLAQNIAFPNESFNISTENIEGAGGYLMGYTSGERASYGSSNRIDITFLETNTDIIDYFIKPWIIASSFKGLIEDGITNEDLKCNITVTLYTRDKASYTTATNSISKTTKDLPVRKFELRKKIIFYNAVPFNVAADAISYNDLSFAELSKTVSFAFSHYNTVELHSSIPVTSNTPSTPVLNNNVIPPNPAATSTTSFFDTPAIPNLELLPPGPYPTPNPAATTGTGTFGGPFTPGRQTLVMQPNPAATTGTGTFGGPFTPGRQTLVMQPNPAATTGTGTFGGLFTPGRQTLVMQPNPAATTTTSFFDTPAIPETF